MVGIMAKTSQPKPDSGMVTVYGKIPRELAERLDRLADERRWSRGADGRVLH
jgi:hypothetical protein